MQKKNTISVTLIINDLLHKCNVSGNLDQSITNLMEKSVRNFELSK